jgi:hypothetical protein
LRVLEVDNPLRQELHLAQIGVLRPITAISSEADKSSKMKAALTAKPLGKPTLPIPNQEASAVKIDNRGYPDAITPRDSGVVREGFYRVDVQI